ncbi:MAG TPA: acyltransferase family protein [Longimicrobium sp.]|jgi:peptidoglycan/LPS O-acetylase OafA/YrhL
MPESTAPRPRRHDLDWLRVIAILLLLYFHTGMIFAAESPWHIKNPETSPLVLEANYFLSRWRMVLLFLISGVGTSYALRKRTAGEYVGERAKRLLVPVLFGILVVVPPQIYLERLAEGARYDSFLHFWPNVLGMRPYPAGDLSYHHLWFVFYLFLYSLAALPLFLLLRSGGEWLRRATQRLHGPGLYALALPPGLVLGSLVVRYPGPQDVVHDWAHLAYYFLFFVYGYLLTLDEGLWAAIERQRRRSLTVAFLSILLINYLRWNSLEPNPADSVPHTAYYGLQALNAWCWVLAFLGFARRYLSFGNRFLAYANEGIYPFYILHQTVIVVIGFYVVQVDESILAKYLFVSTVSLLLTWGVYDLLVRPVPALRFLFGMKPRQAPGPGAVRIGTMPARAGAATRGPRVESAAV